MRPGRLCQSDHLYKVTPSGTNWTFIVGEIKKIAKQRDARPANRRVAYMPPKLKEFGPVGALTQGGATGAKETSMGQMNFRP